MKSRLSVLWIALVSVTMAFATDPSVSLTTYYANIDGKSNTSDALRTQLSTIISTGYTIIGYSSLPDDVYAASSNPSDFYNGASKTMEDIYSSYPYTASQAGASATDCGQRWNKEHTVPKSWFGGDVSPMESDAHHIFPTDIKMNSLRSSYPFGENNAAKECANYGYGHLGTSTFSGYTGTVFDPGDGGANGSYKGDLARVYFYMVTRYRTTNFTSGLGNVCFTYSGNVANLTDYMKNLMLKWHREDPVSEKERIRNNAIYAHQHNRNPFVDYPCLVEYIWGDKQGETVSLAALVSSYDSSFSGEGCSCAEQPATPSVNATAGDGQITATWSDVADATGYTVTIGTGVGYTTECASPSIGAITHSGTTNTCVISGLINGLDYTVSVVANGTCDSEAGTDSATPTDEPLVCALTSITLNTDGVTKDFTTGDAFSSAGLVVTANYSNCASHTVTPTSISSPDMSSAGNKTITVTYTENEVTKTATYQITVSDPVTYTIRFFNNGVQVGATQNLIAGAVAVKPSDPTPCTSDYTFVGWWTAALAEDNTTTYSWVTDFTVTGAQDYYAVYSKTEGGGSLTPATLEASYSSHTGWTVSGTGGSSYWILKEGASITSPVISDLSTVTSITFTARTYGGASYNTVNVTTGSTSVGSATASSTSMVSKTVNVSGLTGSGSLVFSSSTTSSANGPGINNIVINYSTGGGGTTYYTTAPECPTPCTNEITITKGDNPANGTFVLSNSGTVCIDEGNASTTVTATPNEHYHLATVTSTSGSVGAISGNECTITGINASTTINVTFAADPKDVVNWYVAGSPTEEERYAGETLAGITAPTSSDCDGVKVFRGWTEHVNYFSETDEPDDLFTDPTTKTMPAGGTNYYAVFADEGTGSGATVTLLSEDFASITTGNSTSTSGSSSSWSGNSNIEFISYAYQAGGAVRIGSGSYSGSIETKTLEATAGTEITVTFDVKGWSSVEGDIRVTVTGCDPQEIEYTAVMGGVFETKSAVFTLTSDNPTVTIATTDKRAFIDNLIVTASGSATIYSNYSTSCVTYEVTAESNNDAWGTVSVDGYKVTATPAEGYIADGYTITFGTATATQNGNIYSVVPTSDCTIRINFRAATPYTVTFYDNNTSYNQTAYELTPFILPEDGLSSCPDATFLGWVADTYTDHATGTTTIPAYVSPGADVTLTGNTSYTAVYGVIAPTDKYKILKAESELESGANYVLAAYSSYTDYMMKATMSDERIDATTGSLVTTDEGNEVTDPLLIWHINVLDKATKSVSFYNASANRYLSIDEDNKIQLDDEPFAFNYIVNESGTNARWDFKSSSDADYMLSFYTTPHQFNAYTSNSTNLYLYKQKIEMSVYTSHPKCCYEPAEPLVIESDREIFVGSGVAHLTLTGGNGKPITWSATGGTLSAQTNTSAILTLPTAATTTSYIVTATQEDDETDADRVICGAEVSVTITVKAQWTITYKTIEENVETEYNTVLVTDGESYTLPDISEEFICPEGISFAGWASSSTADAVEHTAGTSQIATADAVWYAVWAEGVVSGETVYLYEQVTSASALAAGDIVIFVNTAKTAGLAGQNTNNRSVGDVATNPDNTNQLYFLSESGVKELTVGKEGDYFTFLSADGYLYAASSSANHLKSQVTLDDNGKWAMSVFEGVVSLTAQGDHTHKYLKYNTNSKIFSCYSSGQQDITIWKKTSSAKYITTESTASLSTNNTCTSGAIIRANTEQWITAAKGQKVKRTYEVKALNFDEDATLTIAGNTDSHFTATLGETAVPAAPGRLETTLTVEYLPTGSDETNSTIITLSAGDVTKTLEIFGRSLPDEFLVITKKTIWYALPANMKSGEMQYDGVVVTPDGGTEPSSVTVAPSTIVYSLRAVDNSRYAENGQCVRLAGNGNKALWGNLSASAITIQNNEIIGSTNGANYEWLFNTTDGIHYSIGNPNHADFEAGRVLAFGDKFGQYKSPTVFYLVPTGCNSQPQDVSVSARRVDATFSWLSNASSMAIDVYTDEEMTVLATSVTATSVPYYMTGLNETTNYWFRLTPDGEDACSVTGSFKTTGPTVDIVEWETGGVVIFVDKDEALNPYVVIEGEVEHGVGTAYNATELFFSKYFEGSGDMKLVAIFNGTPNDISLADYSLYTKNCSAPKNEGAIASSAFTSTTEYPISALGIIKSGQEIVFFTRPSATSTQASLSECSEAFLNEMAAKSGADEMPRWIECNNSTLYNGQKFPAMQFNGNDAICLEKNDALIDVIGTTGDPGKVKNCANRLNDIGWSISVKNIDFGKDPNDASFAALYEASSKEPITDAERRAILGGFNINMTDETIDLTTARCILFRDKSVTSGERAVALNTGAEFATCAPFTYEAVDYPSEWNGRAVCMTTAMQTAAGVTDDSRATCNSYQDLGEFDYNDYYKEWTSIDGKTLDEYTYHENTKTYDIPIDNLSKYTCLNIRFQLKNDAGEVVTESPVQVPIIVKGGHQTIDAIFNEIVKTDDPLHPTPLYDQSIDRCKTCDVVILSDGVLTKQSGTTSELESAHDVPEVGNVKIYPGGQLIVPSGTSYTVNSLAFRRQEDAVSTADIQGNLNIKEEGKSVFLDVRIDPTNWHFISLPFDCNVSDIRFANDELKIPILGTDYLLQWYDGERRAATRDDDAWEPVKQDDVLKKGLGYIFALPGDGKVKREFRFPMANDVIDQEQDDKTIGNLYGYGCDKTDQELRPNHKGWNLVGAPYLMSYSSDIAEPLRTGKLIPDPEDPKYWIIDPATTALRYIVEPINNGWDGYRQVTIANYPMTPFTSYFVQIGGDDPKTAQGVAFNASRVERNSIVRRNPMQYEDETEDNHPVWCAVTITNAKGEKDETTMLVSNDFTDGYDMMNDLVKMRGIYYQYASVTTAPIIASRNNEGEMAFNALPDASAEAGIPLHYFAASNGEYTIAYNDKYGRQEVKAVMLLDKQTNEWTDLMNDSYSFTSKRTDDKNRFMLVIHVERKKTPDIVTGIGNTTDYEAPRKILIQDHVYIVRGGILYDITGKKMLNR